MEEARFSAPAVSPVTGENKSSPLFEAKDAWEEEEESLRAAVDAAERLGRLTHRRLDALISLADYYTERGRVCEAEPLWVKALSLQEKIYGPGHQKLAAPMVQLSRHLEAMGRLGEAEAVLLLALTIHEKDAAQNSDRVVEDLMALARLDALWARWGQGDLRLGRAHSLTRIVHGDDSVWMARFHTARGAFHREAGRFDKARASLSKAAEIFSQGHRDSPGGTVEVWVERGHLAKAEGHFRNAETFYRRSHAAHIRTEGEVGRAVSRDLFFLTVLFLAEGQWKRALKQARRVLDIRANSLGPRHPDVAEAESVMAEAHARLRQFEEAESGFLRAWAIFEQTLGPHCPGLLNVQSGLASLYFDRGCFEEADRLLAHLVRSNERIYGSRHPAVRAALNNQRVSWEAQERWDEVEMIRKRLSEMENDYEHTLR
jgi:tetratricopeptide (TPR) repeat protein